jgi:hypothetical protein
MRVIVVLVVLGFAVPASAGEPWSDADPAAPPDRVTLAPDSPAGFRGALEYRANALSVRPLDLANTRDQNFETIEQRLRLDGTVDYDDKVRLTASVDALDGVLWGDNGTRGQSPEPTSGAAVATNNPNLARACVTLRPGDPPTQASSYRMGLCPADALRSSQNRDASVAVPFSGALLR